VLAAAMLLSPMLAFAQLSGDARDAIPRIVERIRRADYEGDRETLERLYEELGMQRSVIEDRHFQSRVRYWRGFALWRRAPNGFNQSAGPRDLEPDLLLAIGEFEEAIRLDPAFVEAKVGLIACLQSLTFLNQSNAARVKELVPRFVQLLEDGLAVAPENPRLLWVHAASQWWGPPGLPIPQVIERQNTAMATYRRALEFARKQRGLAQNPLEPSWGEPELLMSLAWANLNQTTPDVRAAQGYARQALALVPYWHYIREILMPQILRRKGRA
jgi:hypothetical protein